MIGYEARVVGITRNPYYGRYTVELHLFGKGRLVLYSVKREDLPEMDDEMVITVVPK